MSVKIAIPLHDSVWVEGAPEEVAEFIDTELRKVKFPVDVLPFTPKKSVYARGIEIHQSLAEAYRLAGIHGNSQVLCIWNFAWAPVRKQDAKRIPRKLKKRAPWLRT